MRKKAFHLKCILLFIVTSTSISLLNAQPFGGFISFDGIDDELSISANTIFQSNSDFTIEFLFRSCHDTLLNHQTFLGNGNNIEINRFPGPPATFHQLCATSNNNTWVCHQDHHYPTDTSWHHIAVTYNFSLDEFEFYFDGIDGTINTSHSYNFAAYGILYIGRSGFQSWIFDHFNGYMDELRISNMVRYNGSFTPPQSEFIPDPYTVGLWHFNNLITNNTVIDNSGNSNHFLASGNPRIIRSDSMIYQLNGTIHLYDTFLTYQWIDCEKDLPIPGQTSPAFSPTATGAFAVLVSDGCYEFMSDCIDFTYLGIDEIENKVGITFYSNPVEEDLSFSIDTNKSSDSYHLQIIHASGLIVRNESIDLFDKTQSISVSDLAAGIYLFRLVSGSGEVFVGKFVKE